MTGLGPILIIFSMISPLKNTRRNCYAPPLSRFYKNYKKAMEAADALRHEEIGPGWTIVVSLIAEVA